MYGAKETILTIFQILSQECSKNVKTVPHDILVRLGYVTQFRNAFNLEINFGAK
jgi:hypothetical protein